MRLAIMQPYLFPYLGYFQLIRAVDRFVLLDDATYSKGGWVNRNVLAGRDRRQPFTFPIRRPHLGDRINAVRLADPQRSFARFRKTLQTLYGGAPRRAEAMALIGDILDTRDDRLSVLIERSLAALCGHLGLGTELCSSAARHGTIALRGSERVLAICRAEGARTYINAEGGTELYRPGDFAAAGIALRFLKHRPVAYSRGGGQFFARLSVIDALMFNAPDEICALLDAYELVEGTD